MTNWEFTQMLLEEGVLYGTFVIMDDRDLFDKECSKHVFSSYPVWDDLTHRNFIKLLKVSTGINFIFNTGLNEFQRVGGFIEMYTDNTLVAQRYRKLSKIRNSLFENKMKKYVI